MPESHRLSDYAKALRRDGEWRWMNAVTMTPKNIQQVQNEIAIVWADGTESYLSLERLRRCCPCAGCGGERDIMGNEYKAPTVPYTPESFQLVSFQTVGGYAINFTWRDRHNTGIYSYELLKKLGEVLL